MRPTRGSRRKQRRLLFSIPIILTVILALSVAYEVTLSIPPAEDFTLRMVIQVASPSGGFSHVSPPANGIGVPGGQWIANRYDTEGIGHNYPVFVAPNASRPGYFLIHVTSRVARNYTLADLFNVWGQPLGPSNTIGIPPLADGSVFWTMCVGLPPNQYVVGTWGSQNLSNGIFIALLYANADCGRP
jgi:hypothetical protein